MSLMEPEEKQHIFGIFSAFMHVFFDGLPKDLIVTSISVEVPLFVPGPWTNKLNVELKIFLRLNINIYQYLNGP